MPPELHALPIWQLALTVCGFFTSVTILSSLSGFAMERLLPKRKIFDVPLFPGQYRFELLGNVMFLAMMTVAFTAVLHAGWVRFGAGGLVPGSLTFFALVFGFQAYYWLLHRLMHTRRLVRFHRWHHRSQVTTPLTGQSMSPGETCGWLVGYIGLPLVFSLFAPISFWGWAGYMAFNIMGNMVGHANVEPTTRISASRAASTFANPFVYHSLHHARWTGHYSFQAALMDRLFGTEWSDWPALYDRITAGQPLTSLKERGIDT